MGDSFGNRVSLFALSPLRNGPCEGGASTSTSRRFGETAGDLPPSPAPRDVTFGEPLVPRPEPGAYPMLASGLTGRV